MVADKISLKKLILIIAVSLVIINLAFYLFFGSLENFAQFKEEVLQIAQLITSQSEKPLLEFYSIFPKILHV